MGGQYTLEPAQPGDLSEHDNLLQSDFWADLKVASGFTAERFTICSVGGDVRSALSGEEFRAAPLLLLLRKVPLGFCFAYVPHGPDIILPLGEEQPFLEWLSGELALRLPRRCAFIRYDLPWRVGDVPKRDIFLKTPFVRSSVDVQVPDTVELDLKPDTESILAGMKSKTRYNIRLSKRKGVVIREGGLDDLDLWYDMARETAERDGITLRGRRYFHTLFSTAALNPAVTVRLLIAEVNEEPIAAVIITLQGKRCIYHYGASRGVKRNYMPTFALQWRAIEIAKAAGCSTYDLLGIPPSGDPRHPMHGLYRLKTGFGGDIVHRAGCWDVPLRPAIFRGLRTLEYIRNLFYIKIRKRLVGRG